MKFKKKPVVIEAMQLNHENIYEKIPAWMGDKYDGHGEVGDEAWLTLEIETLEGLMTANQGDWIIRGVKGEFYPCKPDIFAMTYEAVDEGDEG